MQFNFSGKIKAFEVLDANSYSVLTKQRELHTENWMINFKKDFRSPIIRRIDNDSILIADSRSNENEKNAVVYHSNGEVINSFSIGDAVKDIIVFDRKLVVSYFDEGVMAQKKFSKEGLAIFNMKGIMTWGFNSNSEYEIWDCYQVVRTDRDKVLFFGYGKFPICELNIDFLTLEEIDIPVGGSVDSVSCENNYLYWKNSKEVYCFNRDSLELKKVLEFTKKDRRMLLGDGLVSITKDGFELEKIKKTTPQQNV
jgi:hypothetical protein